MITDPRCKAVPPGWVGPLLCWCDELRAAGRSAETVALRRAHIAQAARALQGSPSSVTAEDLLGWLASRTWERETRRPGATTVNPQNTPPAQHPVRG